MIFNTPTYVSLPTTQSLSYGFDYTKSDMDYLSNGQIKNFPFGMSENDAIEIAFLTSDDSIVSSAIITSSLTYSEYTKSFSDIGNRRHTYGYNVFQSDFVVVGDATRSVFLDGPTILSTGGISSGTYKTGINLVRYLVSDPFDENRMLMVREISPSRKEISVSPMPLATSTDELDAQLIRSFDAFSTNRVFVKDIVQSITSAIENPSIYTLFYSVSPENVESVNLIKYYYAFKTDVSIISFLTDIYYGVNKGSIRNNGQIASNNILGIFDQFKNILLENYESVTTFEELRTLYFTLLNQILSKELTQYSTTVATDAQKMFSFFQSVMYDHLFVPAITKLETTWNSHFSGYLKNNLCFFDGTSLPLLNFKQSSRTDESGHKLLLIKLTKELPQHISIGDKLWIANKMASDSIVQNIYFYEYSPIVTKSVRGPNFLINEESIGNGTELMSMEDVISATGSLYDDVYALLQTKSSASIKLNVDYRYFENFVRFSSASDRLSIFETKYDRINVLSESISEVKLKLDINPMDTHYQQDLENYNTEYNAIESSMDGYEKFLYDNRSWYNEHSRVINGMTSASLYDRDNMTSLQNSLPEYIKDDSNNIDYLKFVSMIGHFFDNISVYVEQFTEKSNPTNSTRTGISTDVVQYMLESLGWDTEIGRENLPVILSSLSKNDFDVSSSLWNMAGTISEDEKSKIVWKRILNNLPYILKTRGTENAINSLINCYGIPNNLIRVKEYGGIQMSYGADTGSLYIFDDVKYSIKFDGKSEYLNFPWSGSVKSLEFNFSFDVNKTNPSGSVYRMVGAADKWTVGIVRDREPDWGRAFFSICDESGSVLTSFTQRAPFFAGDSFSLLLVKNPIHSDFLLNPTASFSETDPYPQLYSMHLHRNDDFRTTFAVSSSILLSGSFNASWRFPTEISIGNYLPTSSIEIESFFGTIDEVKLWEIPVDLNRFDNHTSYLGAYDSTVPNEVVDSLLFHATFDIPEDLNTSSGVFPIANAAPKKVVPTAFAINFPPATSSVTYNAECNYTECYSNFPYQFSKNSVRQYVKLPNFGSTKFKNNKIIKKDQILVSDLSSDSRSTLVSGYNGTIDTNKLGIFFSPTEVVDDDIMRFFGDIEFGDLIGDPTDVYEKTYKHFERFRTLYFNSTNKSIDHTTYLNLVRGFFDKSIFKYIKNLVPARSKVITGTLLEPTILERSKIQQKPIQHEIHRNLETTASITNDRILATSISTLSQSLDIKTVGTAHYEDINSIFYSDSMDPYGFGVYADNGVTYYRDDYWRADVLPTTKTFSVLNKDRVPFDSVSEFDRINTNNAEYTVVSKSFNTVNLSRFPVLYRFPIIQSTKLIPNTTLGHFEGTISSSAIKWGYSFPMQPNTVYYFSNTLTSTSSLDPLRITGITSGSVIQSGSLAGSIIDDLGVDGTLSAGGSIFVSGKFSTVDYSFTGSMYLVTGTTYSMNFYSKTPIFDTFKTNGAGPLFKSMESQEYLYRYNLSMQNIPSGSKPLDGYFHTHYRYKKSPFSRLRSRMHSSPTSTTFYQRGLQTQKTTIQENGLLDNSPPVVITRS